jgi:hypothetical protein
MSKSEWKVSILRRCEHDPALFNKLILGRTLWRKQVEVCDLVARSPITIVPAGRAVGKSYLLAGIVLWWLYTRPNSLVITTGPDHRQVISVLWKELKNALQPAQYIENQWVGDRFGLPYEHLSQGFGSPQRLMVKDGWGAIGFACKSTEGFSGQHAADMMVIVDEASGVAPNIWEAIWGAGASKYVIAGNPIRYDCNFRELYDKSEAGSPDLRAVRISSLDHPHATLESSPVGAVSAAWLRQSREIYGEGSPWWQSNVLGLFPGQESVRFIPLAWLDRCTDPAILDDPEWQDYPAGLPWMGVDVGGGVGADRSVVVVRDRKRLLDVFASAEHGVLDDANQRLEPVVRKLACKWDIPGPRIVYDQNGIGRNFGSYLANHGIEGAIGHFGGGRGGWRYFNRRSANAGALKNRLDPGRAGFVPFYCGNIPVWNILRQEIAEIRSAQEWDEGSVKVAIEDKATMMDRLRRSPDLLDAFLQTFAFTE